MKAGQLSQALTLAAELGRIKGMIAAAEADEMIIMVGRHVGVGTVYNSDQVLADPALVATIKLDVLPYLQRRRRALEDSLRELGVDPD